MQKTLVTVVLFFVLTIYIPGPRTAAAEPERFEFETTVELYFSADRSYRLGDLIAHSHLDDLQQYLRRTGGEPLAAHSRWLKKTLKDHAPLVKVFYSGGRKVLREAAEKLGGYAELDQLSRSGAGRKRLRDAIDSGASVKLVEFLLAQRSELDARKDSSAKSVSSPRLYTAADFVKALASARKFQKENLETGADLNR